MIPGEDLLLPESDLLQSIGKYLMLYEHEQKKRLILLQAYNQVVAELEALKNPKLGLDDVVQGNP
jgi:hypothetical protein